MNRKILKKGPAAISVLFMAMMLQLMVSPAAAQELSMGFNRDYVVTTGYVWKIVESIPIPLPYPAVARMEVTAYLWWWPSWGMTITAGDWLATISYFGNDFPLITTPVYATYFKMVVKARATPWRGGSYSETYVWEFPEPGDSVSVVSLTHNMDGQIGLRCFSASVKVTLTVRMNSIFGPVEHTLSTTAYAS
jgi:hypothetical protein